MFSGKQRQCLSITGVTGTVVKHAILITEMLVARASTKDDKIQGTKKRISKKKGINLSLSGPVNGSNKERKCGCRQSICTQQSTNIGYQRRKSFNTSSLVKYLVQWNVISVFPKTYTNNFLTSHLFLKTQQWPLTISENTCPTSWRKLVKPSNQDAIW